MSKKKYTKRNNKSHNQILPSKKQFKETRDSHNIDSHESPTGLCKRLLTILKNILHLNRMQESAGNEVDCMNEQSPCETINYCINELHKQLNELSRYTNPSITKQQLLMNTQNKIKSIMLMYNNNCNNNAILNADLSILNQNLNKIALENFIKTLIYKLEQERNNNEQNNQSYFMQHHSVTTPYKPTENNPGSFTGTINNQYAETISELRKQIEAYRINLEESKKDYSRLQNDYSIIKNEYNKTSSDNVALKDEAAKYNEYQNHLQIEKILSNFRANHLCLSRPLKHILSGMILIIDKINDKETEWLNKEIDKIISHIYTSPEPVGLLSSYGQIDLLILYQIIILQKWAHDKLNDLGIKIIYPIHGDSFNSSKHEFSDRDLVWITDDSSLHNKIHSVISVGFENTVKQTIIRKARIKRYAYVPGDQSTPQPSETQHDLVESISSEQEENVYTEQDESSQADSISDQDASNDDYPNDSEPANALIEVQPTMDIDLTEQNNSIESKDEDSTPSNDEKLQLENQEDEPSNADEEDLRNSAMSTVNPKENAEE